MKKSHFTNKTFYWTIIAIIVGLMIWNLYATISTGNLLGLIPVAIEGVLLALILTNNQYAKIGIKIWIIIFMVIGSGLQFIGRLLQDAGNNFATFNALHYITTGLTVLIGVLIVVYVNKTVEVLQVEE